MHSCPSCGTELPDKAQFCKHCGHALAAKTTIDEATKSALLEDTQPPSSIGSRTSSSLQKRWGTLLMPLQRAITELLTRVRDPKPEESRTSAQDAGDFLTITWGWLPFLALFSTLGLLSVAYAYTSARLGATGADIFFWLGILLIFVPSAVRLISPAASRFERVGLLCVVTICFYLVYVLGRPFSFSGYDSLLHLRTADNVARSGHLFSVNSLLPASPFYPGLEIATNALSRLSGLSTFDSGTIVVGVAYLVLTLTLFLLYERVTKSARIAGIATILYMTNPHFLFFDTQFSYESLALPLATLVLFALVRQETLGNERRWMTLAAWIALGAVVVTHHMTSYIFDGLFILWTIVFVFQRPARAFRSNLSKTALLGACMTLGWIGLKGNPVVGYLSSYFRSALDELGGILTGTSSTRQFFVDYSGQAAPLWERYMALASVALITLCLPLGLLCLWQRYRYSALAWTFGIASLFYPASQVFRFTNLGSAITDRAAAFLFIPIACILAIFIAQFWPTRQLSKKQTALITVAVSVVFLGGAVLGSGPPWELLPGPYLVAADARSIEPEGIQAAFWAGSYLGPDNRIGTDRINALLMNAFGNQFIVNSLADNINVTPVFFSPSLGPIEVSILQHAGVQYLVVDRRLSTGLPALGFYFEPDEPGAFQHTNRISLLALTKFNTVPQIDRVFDSGDLVIYDVGGLTNAP